MTSREQAKADLVTTFVREALLYGFNEEEFKRYVDTAWKVLTSEREPDSAAGDSK